MVAKSPGGSEDDEDEEAGGNAGKEEGEVALGSCGAEIRFGWDVFLGVGVGGAELEEDDD